MTIFYKTKNLINLPVHNVFNRTCIFEPVGNKYLGANDGRSTVYSDTLFKVSIKGYYLNCSVDYPLFVILVAEYINNIIDDIDLPHIVTIPLSKIVNSIGVAGKGTRDTEFKKIYESLHRLNNTHVDITTQTSKEDIIGNLIEDKNLDFPNKTLTVIFGSLIIDLYNNKNHVASEIKFMDIEKVISLKNEGNIGLYRYLETQSESYIDFTLERLSKVLGYHYRVVNGSKDLTTNSTRLKDSKKRSYIKLILQRLQKLNIITDFHHDEKTDWFRILQTKFYPNVVVGKDIHAFKSNIKQIKYDKSKQKLDDDFDF